MITYKTTDERLAALAAGEVAYKQWAERHGVDADEADDAQLAELDAMQARAEQDAVDALRTKSA